MLTQFGKELRKIRLDRDEHLKDMAQKLNVTVAYLSAVENGNRRVPETWLPIIADNYHLSDNEVEKLQRLAYSKETSISINIGGIGVEERNLAFSFARRFNNLSDEEKNEIQKILNKER